MLGLVRRSTMVNIFLMKQIRLLDLRIVALEDDVPLIFLVFKDLARAFK